MNKWSIRVQVTILQNEKKRIQYRYQFLQRKYLWTGLVYIIKLNCLVYLALTEQYLKEDLIAPVSDTNMLVFMCAPDMGPLSGDGMPPLTLTEKKKNSQRVNYLQQWQERKASSSVMSAVSTAGTHSQQLQLTVSAARLCFCQMW